MAVNEYLAVYGTLRPGFTNTYALLLQQQGRYVGEGTFPGYLFDLGSYPGAIYLPGNPQQVNVSVYDITQHRTSILAQLDLYEGVGAGFDQPTEYVRTQASVVCAGQTFGCWLYVYNWLVADEARIPSGDYLEHRMGHKKNGL